jgi:hypothetical protein
MEPKYLKLDGRAMTSFVISIHMVDFTPIDFICGNGIRLIGGAAAGVAASPAAAGSVRLRTPCRCHD